MRLFWLLLKHNYLTKNCCDYNFGDLFGRNYKSNLWIRPLLVTLDLGRGREREMIDARKAEKVQSDKRGSRTEAVSPDVRVLFHKFALKSSPIRLATFGLFRNRSIYVKTAVDII